MGLKIGLVGLPNVGKSTLFNALTKTANAVAANFPFCTIEPNVGIVTINDERLNKISEISGSKKKITEIIEFVDIAGLVKGASSGEGLGNKFLSHIRNCDAIAMVLRFFEDKNVTHVSGVVDPKDDKEIIETELIMADLQVVDKFFDRYNKLSKSGNKENIFKLSIIKKIKEVLEMGEKVSTLELNKDEEIIWKELQLLTSKKFLYIANTSEEEISNFTVQKAKEEIDISTEENLIPISAKIEEEISGLNEDEAEEFLKDMNLDESGLQKIAKASHTILNLSQFFTSGVEESRAWTILKNSTAPQAAGKIHTDFEKGFIKADVVSYEDFVKYEGWTGCRENGVCRIEGKDYIMNEGDICLFKFNV